jgi:hypothetical protein
VGFFIVGYGTQIGFFSGNGPDDAAAQADPPAEPTQPPPAAAPSQPQVIDEYVYRDVFLSSPDAGAASGEAAPQSAPAPAGATQGNPPTPTDSPAPQQTAPKSVEFTGEVTAVSGSTFTVDAQSGQFSVTLDPQTSVHGGELEVGATVKVHGYRLADGDVVAKEVEVAHGD